MYIQLTTWETHTSNNTHTHTNLCPHTYVGHMQAPTLHTHTHSPMLLMFCLDCSKEKLSSHMLKYVSPRRGSPCFKACASSSNPKHLAEDFFVCVSVKPSACCPHNKINTAANSAWIAVRGTHNPYTVQTEEKLSSQTNLLLLCQSYWNARTIQSLD